MKKLLTLLLIGLFLPNIALGAISFVSTTNGGNNGGGSTLSYNVTIASGQNLVVAVRSANETTSADNITSVTYNGDAMTQIAKHLGSQNVSNDDALYIYYLQNPDVGTNSVAITSSAGSGETITSLAWVISGAGTADTSAGAICGSNCTEQSVGFTPAEDNTWAFGLATENAGANLFTFTGSWSIRTEQNNIGYGDSNGSIGTGSKTFTATHTSAKIHVLVANIKQATAAVAPSFGDFILFE